MLHKNWNFLKKLPKTRQIGAQQRFLRSVRSATNPRTSTRINDSEEVESILDQQTDCNYLGINERQDFPILSGQRVYDSEEHRKQVEEKFEPLLRPNKKNTTGVRKKIGLLNVRLDSENRPRFHGEFEKRDELVFKTLDSVISHIGQHKVQLEQPESDREYSVMTKLEESDFIVDENIEPCSKSKSQTPKSILDDRINFRYANQLLETGNAAKKSDENQAEDWITFEQSKREPKPPKIAEPEMSLSEKIANIKLESPSERKESDSFSKTEVISGYEYLKQIRAGKRSAHFQEEFDKLKDLIGKKEKLDSKGYRVLSNQVPDFSKLTNAEVLDMLEKQIVFNGDEVVGLNKPYGIAVHGAFGCSAEKDPKQTLSTSRINSKFDHVLHLGYFLPLLAERLGCSKLYTVHRLDRDTTGALLLAKTQEKAQQLNMLFKEQRIQKRYYCITKNVPDQREGIIDIPIELGYIKSKDGKKRERMVLCPEPLEAVRVQRQWRMAKRAITYYKVISEHGNAALLEVKPETGVRHQIRVHLGFGLRCPILGDHKYSHLDSLSPQKLPTDILMALKIRQAKARDVPMHLHAYMLVIPQAGKDGQNIFVRAPFPYHFRKNMRSLKLNLDD